MVPWGQFYDTLLGWGQQQATYGWKGGAWNQATSSWGIDFPPPATPSQEKHPGPSRFEELSNHQFHELLDKFEGLLEQ